MALRLTTTTLEPERQTPAQIADAEQQAVQQLVGRAAGALSTGATADYLTLFDTAAEFENPQRVYQARRLLLEQAMVLTGTVSDRRATEIFLAMAHGAVRTLEETPAEPLLLNYAGIALYELWSLDAARTLFQAAKRLDPNLPHVDQNLKGVSQRSRSHDRKQALIHPALRALSQRATQVARRAKPAVGLTLSLCMIVRDEEEMLPRCLEAVAPAVDEIIVVDTGSQDRTIEIARSFGAKVIEREWTGSFSDARNASFEAATGDWLLYLDADEVLIKEDVEKLKALTGETWREAFYLVETNFTGTIEIGMSVQHSALRGFRNRPDYRFQGRLHEQIAYSLPGYVPERLTQTTVRVDHYGYLGVVREAKDKVQRNLELLRAQQKEGAPSPFLHFNIGAEYAAMGDIQQALPEFEGVMAIGRAVTRRYSA